VSIIRKRGEYLGVVEGRDRKAAETAAVRKVKLSDERCKRLAVRD
jgi:hypothetical protein